MTWLKWLIALIFYIMILQAKLDRIYLISLLALVTLGLGLKLHVIKQSSSRINLKIMPYLIWLYKEIIISAFEVIKIILSPKLKVDPSVISIKILQKNTLEQVMLANSITLTPGTISMEVKDEIKVHCLNPAFVVGLTESAMLDNVKNAVKE